MVYTQALPNISLGSLFIAFPQAEIVKASDLHTSEYVLWAVAAVFPLNTTHADSKTSLGPGFLQKGQ